MTTANKITIFRIVLIPVFLVLAYTGHLYWALAAYVLACLSDFADGYIARHYNQITDFGKFMDPLADKMLVLAAMCFFVEKGHMPGWLNSKSRNKKSLRFKSRTTEQRDEISRSFKSRLEADQL